MSTLPKPGFIENFKNVLFKNYANFNGRARRSEYWLFVLFEAMVLGVLVVISAILNFAVVRGKNNLFWILYIPGGIIGVFLLAMTVPGIALQVRRLHDIGKSGYFWFFNFIPFVGILILLYFTVLDSQKEENEYGSSPKYSIVSDGGLTE